MNSHHGITYETQPQEYDIRVWCYWEGDLIPDRYVDHYDTLRMRAYHVVRSEAAIETLCKSLYWHRVREVERPLERLQQSFREGLERKTQHLYQEARHETWKDRRRQRAARAYGRAEEQVKPSDVRGVKEADPGTLGVTGTIHTH